MNRRAMSDQFGNGQGQSRGRSPLLVLITLVSVAILGYWLLSGYDGDVLAAVIGFPLDLLDSVLGLECLPVWRGGFSSGW